MYIVQNLVVTFRLARMFPLEEIVKSRALGTSVRKIGRPWLGLRVGPQNRYVAIYPNGKIVVTGCRTIEETREVSKEIAGMLASHIESKQPVSEPVIQNIVATSDLGRKLDLVMVARALAGQDFEYEPEQFPGLVLRLRNPRSVVIFFRTGNLVLTGTKSFGELEKAVDAAVRLVIDASQ
ncbi:MAG TPA: hypothetical protein VF992_04920 [Thermoplasmata archaeon]